MKFLVQAILTFGGLAYFFSPSNTLDWYWFFIIVFGSLIISEVLFVGKSNKPRRATAKKQTRKSPNKKSSVKLTKQPRKKKTDLEILQTPLEDMNGVEFERLVALYFDAKGYAPQLIGGSGDHEVDIVLTDPKENYKIAVQCKHWKTKKVGNDTILRLSAGKRVHKCIDAWCITTNYYTKAAEEAAEGTKVKLWNGLHVHSNIVKWQQEQIKSAS